VADIRDSFWQMMRAGWKLWPFVHIVTYTMIPTRFKLLWVDMVEVRSDPSNLGR
jgi:protein Mpv17